MSGVWGFGNGLRLTAVWSLLIDAAPEDRGAVAGLALNWFGDSLDGTVARIRNHQRPRYGFYVDHVVDVVSMALLCAGLAHSPHMSPVIALLLLAAYLMVSAEAYLATHACGVFRVSLL